MLLNSTMIERLSAYYYPYKKNSRMVSSCTRRRVGGTRKHGRCTRYRVRASFLFLLLLLLLLPLPACHATVLSSELRDLADTQLLFWSSFDFVMDAALNFLGPIDEMLRETPRVLQEKEEEEEDSTSPVEGVSTVLDNHTTTTTTTTTFMREAKSIFTNLLRGGGGGGTDKRGSYIDEDDSTVTLDQDEQEEQDLASSSSSSSSCTTECNYRQHAAQHNTWEETTQNHNHSSLQVPRGGGGGGRGRQKFEFSLFQEGDGSDQDPDGIPTRYLDMHNGKRDLAAKSLEASLQWRKDQNIDNILTRPHTKFDLCKQIFPSTFLGRDEAGHVIFMQRPALMDLELAKRNKLKKEELLEHYIYMNEYLWQIMEGDKPLGTMVSVLDLTGLNMSVLRKREYIEFLKLFVKVMDSHFPQRAHKTLIVNSPKWVGTIFRILSPLLREETKSRIEIVSKSKKQDDVLKRYLGPRACKLLPESFWSKNKKRKRDEQHQDKKEETMQFPESELDTKLRSHVASRNQASGKKMVSVA